MQVQCVICDKVEDIQDSSLEAKRLLNRRNHIYLCDPCTKRISDKTIKRHETGNFKLYRDKKQRKKHLTD